MNRLLLLGVIATALAGAVLGDPPEPKFRAITLDDKVQIGYGVTVADVDGDGLPDVLLADKKQFVWYKNPGGEKTHDPAAWTRYVLAENLTANDNVCIAAQDIDGDGKCEIAVGAEWNSGDTVNSGAVFYLIPPTDRTQKWEPVKFPSVEPTTHRMRWIQLGEKEWGLIVCPLHGRGNKNGEGAPAKILLYHPPTPLNDPKGEWTSEVIDESMHMTHNFDVISEGKDKFANLLIAGREGIDRRIRVGEGEWQEWHHKISIAPAGEARQSQSSAALNFIASIEPMHGNQLWAHIRFQHEGKLSDGDLDGVDYRDQLLTDKLTEGHALRCGDLLGVKSDQIVVGWHGTPGKEGSTVGVHLWTPLDEKGEKWRDSAVDDSMSCEDLTLADLEGDGKLDIVASGRATHNLKIYFNQTPR